MRRVIFWGVLVATLAVYLAMVLWTLPEIAARAGGLAPFDLRPFGYSVAEAQALLAALDDDTRAFYRDVQHRLDLVFPGLLALSLILLFRRLVSPVPAAVFGVVALAGAGFDWAENAAVAGLLAAEAPGEAAIAHASLMTGLKSAAVTLAGVAALAALIRAGLRRGRGV